MEIEFGCKIDYPTLKSKLIQKQRLEKISIEYE